MARLEHVNITVPDNAKTAAWIAQVFGWHIRWQGDAVNGQGTTIHIGTDDDYIALYTPHDGAQNIINPNFGMGGLNHIAVVVENLDQTEQRVKDAGFTPISHANYEPGRRFYFLDQDGIEFEVVEYA